MEYKLVSKYSRNSSFLLSNSNVVKDIDNNFFKLTGYTREEVLNKKINVVFSKLLRLPHNTYEKLESKGSMDCFLFTKSLEVREVTISLRKEAYSENRIGLIKERRNPKQEFRHKFIEKLINDNHTGIALYSCPDLRMLKANQKYLDFMGEPYNRKEDILGHCLKGFVIDFEGNKSGDFLFDIISMGVPICFQEIKDSSGKWGDRYWDNTLVPLVEDGEARYIVSMLSEVTDRVLNRERIEEQNEIVIKQNKLLEEYISACYRIKRLRKALERIRELIHSTLDFDELMKRVIVEASKAINCETAVISLRKGDKWVVSYTCGFGKDIVGMCMDDSQELPAALAIKSKKPVVIEDALNDKRISHENIEKWGVRSVIVVPMLTEGQVIGVIFFNYYEQVSRFYESDVEFVQNLACSLSMALQNVKLYEKVCKELAERKKTEKEKNEALRKAIDMKDEFLSLISHEFKTPLTVINSAIQAMEFICRNELSDKSRGFLNKIRQNSNRQWKLVNNLLDITRINAGHFKICKTNTDIVALTRAITESITVFAEQKRIKLSFSSTLKKKVIGIDEEKYERIILNLLSNAVKFTQEGKPVSVKVYQKIVKGKCKVCIQVKDKGVGIPLNKQDLIFERFGQVDSSLSRQAEGTGIGLSLVKMLVEILDGEITLESREGVGSTFIIILPVIKIKETPIEKMINENAGNRLVQATAIEFSDIY